MKRLIICCDGTWNTPESSAVTNVVHIARAVKPLAPDGTHQVVYYDWGVGTDDRLDAITGGGFGEGLDRNILDAYRFLVHNYAPGDEIFFFGFSRGAYTARSCIGLIRNAWLLKKQHSHLIPQAYHIYRTHWGPDADNAVKFREPHGQPISIRFLGVWDTIGALGIPLDLFSKRNMKKYQFHDTTISSSIQNAYHALAIDERRKPYAPTIWKTQPERTRTEQSWFAGAHSDVGGGYREAGLSHIALQWMIDKASAIGLAIDNSYLETLYGQDTKTQTHNSYRGLFRALGSERRTIGVTNLDETLHPSAEQRFMTTPTYRPRNLADYLKKNEQIQLPI